MTMTEAEGPSITAALGATVDVVSGAAATMKRIARRLDAAPMQPVSREYPSSGIVPAGGFLVLWLAGPDQGHYWQVRSIVVGGATPATVAAGRADVFITATDLRLAPSVAAIGLNDWRDQRAALPSVGFYGSGQMRVGQGQELFVVLSTATPAQQYTAVAYIEDFQHAALTQDIATQ